MYNPLEMQSIFEEHMEKASYIIKNKKGNYLNRWWTEDINVAYRYKREKLRNHNRSMTMPNLLELQKTRAALKRAHTESKTAVLQRIC